MLRAHGTVLPSAHGISQLHEQLAKQVAHVWSMDLPLKLSYTCMDQLIWGARWVWVGMGQQAHRWGWVLRSSTIGEINTVCRERSGLSTFWATVFTRIIHSVHHSIHCIYPLGIRELSWQTPNTQFIWAEEWSPLTHTQTHTSCCPASLPKVAFCHSLSCLGLPSASSEQTQFLRLQPHRHHLLSPSLPFLLAVFHPLLKGKWKKQVGQTECIMLICLGTCPTLL